MTNWYQRVLGHPFVYNHVRPFVVGGVDNSPAWRELAAGADDVVLDVGCGTGDGLEHVGQPRAYHGFDTDPVAIRFARQRAAGRPGVFFEERRVEAADLDRIQPTRVMLCGLLHHLPDDDAMGLLGMLSRSKGLRHITTVDVTYLPGRYLNNLFTRLDRGKFPRKPEGYAALAQRGGLRVAHQELFRSHPTRGRATYVMMGLEPAARS